MLPTPPIDLSWQAELDQHHPRVKERSWLLVQYEPGDEWEPINRWFVWHMHPVHFLDHQPDRLAELTGPSPRSTGHFCAPGYCHCAINTDAWRDGATFSIDFRQWQLYQEYGHYAQRWWVVQGDEGGHRYRLTNAEKRVNKLLTNKYDTPRPGDLPYAPFDQRAFDKIMGFGEWHNLHSLRGLMRQYPERVGEYEDEVNKLLGALMLKWADDVARKSVDELTRAEVQAAVEGAPVGLGRYGSIQVAHSMEEVERQYLAGML